MTDRFAGAGYESPDAGRRGCASETDPGLRKGEYRIASVSVHGRTATTRLALAGGGSRTYQLARGGKLGWQIDSVSEEFKGKIGDTFTLRDSYTQDGNPVSVNLRVTVLAVQDNVADPQYFPAGHGKRWVRARIKLDSRSNSSFNQSTGDFRLLDAEGQRYDSDGAAFQPSLGNGGTDLTKGDTVVGYLGFRVPKSAKLREIRLIHAGGGGAPLECRI